MKVAAIIPVSGREIILKHTIGRLVNQVDVVICAGHTDSECEVVEAVGGLFYKFVPQATLGQKWQSAANFAREHDPDALLIMGSASMVSDNWIDTFSPYLEQYDMVGAAGIHYYHIEKKQLCYWSGYKGGRAIEPIGVGRMIRRSALDALDWHIFETQKQSGLDGSTMRRLAKIYGKVLSVKKHKACSVRLSSSKWPNTNSYEAMLRRSKLLKGNEIDGYFPGLKNIKL